MKDLLNILLKRLLKAFRLIPYLFNSHYRTLRRSRLFDAHYYVDRDRDIDVRFMSPLIHYIELGWKEGRNPGLMFDSAFYRKMYPQCEGMDPLLHFVQKGWHEGKKPTPFFDTSWYASEYPESVRGRSNPLDHYLQFGWKSGVKPNALMDFSGYIENHPEIKRLKANPFVHYVVHGYQDQSGPLPLFDAEFYKEDNPNFRNLSLSPLAHYIQYGYHDGRVPNRFFDPKYYQETYQEAGSDQLTAFLHYTAVGCKENYRPNRLFDPVFYAETYPEFSDTHTYPLQHYQHCGVLEGKYPCGEIADLAKKPVVSIVTPVYNTDEKLLRRCIHSVLYQAYPHWELCLVDDGSSKGHVLEILDEYERLDERIKIRQLPRNLGISGASNEAAAMATGEYLGFLDHDDELTQDALYEVIVAINNFGPDVIYSDEDLVNLENRYTDSFYKPDFNPELLLTHNYITHFLVTRRELFETCGGFSDDFSGAQDFDLVLKLTEKAENIYHIARSLYSWRASETSTSINHSQKEYADAAGRKALEAAIERRGIDAGVEPGEWRYYYRVKRKINNTPSVALIVDMTGSLSSPEKWLEKMETYLGHDALDIHLISSMEQSGGDDETVSSFFLQVRVHCPGQQMSPAARYNSVAKEATASQLLFLNHTFVPKDDQWLHALLEYSHMRKTGVVTGWVEYDEKQTSFEQIDFTAKPSGMEFKRFFLEASRDLNNVYCAQNTQGASVDLYMVKRELFWESGGFDEVQFPAIFFDVDLSLKLLQKGYMHFYTPYCQLQGRTRIPVTVDGDGLELNVFKKKWQNVLAGGNPYYNLGRLVAEKKISKDKWLHWYSGI